MQSLKLKSKTQTVSIRCPTQKAYEFISNLENLPKWAPAFAKSIAQTGGQWVIQTDQGPVGIRMCEKNSFGVVDHYVSPAPGVEIYVPMRIVANGSECEAIFTLFQMPGMTEERFAQDTELVRRDLNTLKQILEK